MNKEDEQLLAAELERYGLPESGSLAILLRHIYANRDVTYAVKDEHIKLLQEKLEGKTLAEAVGTAVVRTRAEINEALDGSYSVSDDSARLAVAVEVLNILWPDGSGIEKLTHSPTVQEEA